MVKKYLLMAGIFLGGCQLWGVSNEIVELKNIDIKINNGILNSSFDYNIKGKVPLEYVQFILKSDKSTYDITPCIPENILNKFLNQALGKISFSFPVKYIPSGSYKLVMTGKYRKEIEKYFLCSPSSGETHGKLLRNEFSASDFELGFRFMLVKREACGEFGMLFRGESGISTNPTTWHHYLISFAGQRVSVRSFSRHLQKQLDIRIFKEIPVNLKDGVWHDLRMICKKNIFEVWVDGQKKMFTTDPERMFSKGTIGFFTYFSQVYYADLYVKDRKTGKIILKEDFSKGKIGEAWNELMGKWQVEKGFTASFDNELHLATIKIPVYPVPPRPVSKVSDYNGANILSINNRPIVPLIYYSGRTGKLPYSSHYLRDIKCVYDAGGRMFCIGVPVKLDSSGNVVFYQFDHLMSRVATACPKGNFILSIFLPDPPWFPESEKFKGARHQGESVTAKGLRVRVGGTSKASLASEIYSKFAVKKFREIIEHIKQSMYADRVIGFSIGGAGYESNWGQPNGYYGLFMDISPAQVCDFGNAMRKKYKTLENLRKAWGKPKVTFENPPLPGIEDRSGHNIGQFRCPSTPENRWILDFLEVYTEQKLKTLLPLFNVAEKYFPNSFNGIYGLFSFNQTSHGVQTNSDRFNVLLKSSGLSWIAGCLNYGDRLAGGVSVYTNAVWRSAELHGKIAIGEADIRTPASTYADKSDSLEKTIEVMRREFGNKILVEHQGMWYFDMQGGWYRDPELLKEISWQWKLGMSALEIPHINVSDVGLVLDEYSWRFFSYSATKMSVEDLIPWSASRYMYDTVHRNIEAVMRIGSMNDTIAAEDMFMPQTNKYKLYIFPHSFYWSVKARRKMRALIKNGATALFFHGAGIVNEYKASLANMQNLLGMKINVEKAGPLVANPCSSAHPMLAGIPKKTKLGNAAVIMPRFYVDDPTARVIAKYNDGKVAIAEKKIGKGRIIYSAVPIILPTFYRNAAKLAGAHIYSNEDDALYASKHFLVVHTQRNHNGKRQFFLPEKVQVVYDLVHGKVIAKDTDSFDIDMPEKVTGLFFLGSEELRKKIQVPPNVLTKWEKTNIASPPVNKNKAFDISCRARVDINGTNEQIFLKPVSNCENVKWCDSAVKNQQYVTGLSDSVSDRDWYEMAISFIPQKDGFVYLSLRGVNNEKTGPVWVEVDRIEICGADLTNCNFEIKNSWNNELANWKLMRQAFSGDKSVIVSLNSYAIQKIKVSKDKKITVKARFRKANHEQVVNRK